MSLRSALLLSAGVHVYFHQDQWGSTLRKACYEPDKFKDDVANGIVEFGEAVHTFTVDQALFKVGREGEAERGERRREEREAERGEERDRERV